MRKVYVVNKSHHDFKPAEAYGSIIFLSEGSLNRYSTNHMVRVFSKAMENSEENDLIVPCSLNVMNSIASAVFASKHKRLNLLLYKEGRYIERNHVLEETYVNQD